MVSSGPVPQFPLIPSRGGGVSGCTLSTTHDIITGGRERNNNVINNILTDKKGNRKNGDPINLQDSFETHQTVAEEPKPTATMAARAANISQEFDTNG